ncbi:hypothetical protein Ac2012v2_007261 [Leucoagaricus gongylophorus]
MMLILTTLSAARRVLLPSVASRVAFTRFISLTPVFRAPAKVGAGATKASVPKKAAKASAKVKAKAKTKAKTKAKPKVKPTKKVKKDEKKSAFKSADLKVPPRPNPSPWTLFIKGHMNNAGKPIQEAQSAVKKLAVEWKSMTPAQQRPYYDQAREQSEEIAKKFEEWRTNVDPLILREINKRRKLKGLPRILPSRTGERKPKPPFLLYIQDFQKQQDSSVTYVETLKQAGAAWRKLSEEKKATYLQAYKKSYQEYRERSSA